MKNCVTKFCVSKIYFDSSQTSGAMHHFTEFCIGYVLKGKGIFWYKGKKYTANPGDVIYIPKGTDYYSMWKGYPQIEFYSISYLFCDPYNKLKYDFHIFAYDQKHIFDSLFSKYCAHEDFCALSDLYLILNDVYKKLPRNNLRFCDNPVAPAINYIEKNFKENITVKTLADLCCFSESRFFSLFKKITGCTPITFKNRVAIQNALVLMANTDMSIEDIAAKLNFASSSYFRRVFKQNVGKTPSFIRKNNSNINLTNI